MSYLPKHSPGVAFTVTATADLTEGRLVTALGAHAAADDHTVIGVAARTVTEGTPVTVYSGGVQRLTASEPIAAGDLVKAAADGTIAAYTAGTDTPEALLGVALEAAATGSTAPVKFQR